MRYLWGIVIGYLLGSISPTYLFSMIKNIDMRKSGTGNLGATNAMLTLGKGFGVAVMIFDIAKAFVPVLICKILHDDDHILMLSVGLAAVVGHAFPFYLKFKGGKGVATLAGLVLAYNPLMFNAFLLRRAVCSCFPLRVRPANIRGGDLSRFSWNIYEIPRTHAAIHSNRSGCNFQTQEKF